MYDKIICFDFDGTLFDTPTPHEGKEIWKKKTGSDWPYGGWWGRVESLNTEVFYIHLNEWVYKKYQEAIADPNAYVILATGRPSKVPKMEQYVHKILDDNNIVFDRVYLNWGGDTFNFKSKLFGQLMAKLKVKEFIMYDDRREHLVKFAEWAKSQPAKISIIDVINKKYIK